MSDWVPCYASLTQGRKRALPRASRFIFLELCIAAREGGGLVELTPGLDLGDSVHDVIGGNRREVHAAVEHLTAEEMIDCHSQPGFLVISNWDRWKLRDATNAERQARFRERKRIGRGNAAVTDATVTSNVTPTVTSNRYANGRNASRSDQKRSEEKRSEGLASIPTVAVAESSLTPDEIAAAESAMARGRAQMRNAAEDPPRDLKKLREKT